MIKKTIFLETELSAAEACIPYKNKPTVTWIYVDGVHDVPVLEKLGDRFGLYFKSKKWL
ncbi:MAG TPA: hypothetical protein VL087_10920 [Nitrospirota bacterium]|nr:hypothetical protein [Nitrospirota bacterium]